MSVPVGSHPWIRGRMERHHIRSVPAAVPPGDHRCPPCSQSWEEGAVSVLLLQPDARYEVGTNLCNVRFTVSATYTSPVGLTAM
jgi:hypothetical protein